MQIPFNKLFGTYIPSSNSVTNLNVMSENDLRLHQQMFKYVNVMEYIVHAPIIKLIVVFFTYFGAI